MIIITVQFIGLVFLVLVLGVFWGTWFSLSRSIEKTSMATFLENGKLFIENLAVPMRILLPSTIVLMIAGLWLYPFKDTFGFILNIVALILMLATLIITVGIEVPIDNQIKRWSPANIPDNWKAVRSRWQYYHTLRTFLCMGSFLLLLASVLFYV